MNCSNSYNVNNSSIHSIITNNQILFNPTLFAKNYGHTSKSCHKTVDGIKTELYGFSHDLFERCLYKNIFDLTALLKLWHHNCNRPVANSAVLGTEKEPLLEHIL